MKKIFMIALALISMNSFAYGKKITFKNLSDKLLPAKALALAEDTFSQNCNPNATYVATGEVLVFERNNTKRFKVKLHVYGEADHYSNNQEGYRVRFFEIEQDSRGKFSMNSYGCESGW